MFALPARFHQHLRASGEANGSLAKGALITLGMLKAVWARK